MPEGIPLRCPACHRTYVYTAPDRFCSCGEVLRPPAPSTTAAAPAATPATIPATDPPHDRLPPTGPPRDRAEDGHAPEADEPKRRAFQGVPVRTARDAVTAAVAYLRWLGYEGIRRADQRPPSGVGLAARGLVAQVDPAARPASLRDVECLWLTAMTESARCVYFSLAGYGEDARARADELGIPLFVLDRAGIPQPVNEAADTLHTHGA
ncbi:hypothetical protein [Streptomyces thermoalcalitolerans]|uniref:Restriction endonuclease type IV Mrr domain-containing protein n=1 Tax=Streptomyces thermoalcalitolerans TaxID=65605 RepID=A0ABN1NP20_9ACTN